MNEFSYIFAVKAIDLGILAIILLILGYIVYITFIKHRHEPCHGCAHARACAKLASGDFVKEYKKCYKKDSKK